MDPQAESPQPAHPPKNLKETNAASYNLIAEKYNRWTEKHHHLRFSNLAELRSKVPQLASDDSPIKVIDLGCGGGRPVLETILSENPKATAVANDMSTKQMDIARQNLAAFSPRVDFMPGDMTTLAFPPNSFDAVIALYSIFHLQADEQAAMIQKIKDWLRPGGCLLANFTKESLSGVRWDLWLGEGAELWGMGPGKEGTLAVMAEQGLDVEKAKVEGDEEESFLWVIARKP